MDSLPDVASRYRGLALVTRLQYAAGMLPAEAASRAIGLALDELKATTQASDLYRRLGTLNGKTHPSYDPAWADEADRLAGPRRDALERQVNSATQVDTSRENSRRAYSELAAFFSSRGDLHGALKAWTRVREYTTSSKQTASASVALMETALLARSWPVLETTIPRSDVVAEGCDNPLVLGKARACAALLCLHEGRYRDAVDALLAIPASLVDLPSSSSSSAVMPGSAVGGAGDAGAAPVFPIASVLHPDDIASLLALTAAATLSREDIRDALTGAGAGAAEGKALLEGAPGLRDALVALVNARYATALELVRSAAATLRVTDPYIGPHVPALVALITQRALGQYLAPFSRVDIAAMGGAFGMSLTDAEAAVADLIRSGRVAGRIDAARHTLVSHAEDPRSRALAAAQAASHGFAQVAEALLRRSAMEKAGLAAGAGQRAAAGGGGRGGRGLDVTADMQGYLDDYDDVGGVRTAAQTLPPLAASSSAAAPGGVASSSSASAAAGASGEGLTVEDVVMAGAEGEGSAAASSSAAVAPARAGEAAPARAAAAAVPARAPSAGAPVLGETGNADAGSSSGRAWARLVADRDSAAVTGLEGAFLADDIAAGYGGGGHGYGGGFRDRDRDAPSLVDTELAHRLKSTFPLRGPAA